MARTRNLKPSFFTNEELAELPPFARLLFQGLWTLADREGRLEDRPKKIKAELFPYDKVAIGNLLEMLARAGFILRYSVGGAEYINIPTFTRHQSPHPKEPPSVIPPPPTGPNGPKPVASKLPDADESRNASDEQVAKNANIPSPNIPHANTPSPSPPSPAAPPLGAPRRGRPPDPLVERFERAYRDHYRVAYPRQQPGDFVQLDKLRKSINGDLVGDLWDKAVIHYFLSPQKKHTLADLCVNFASFQKSAIDRYGKPVGGQNGGGNAGRGGVSGRIVGDAAPKPGKYSGIGGPDGDHRKNRGS